VAGVAPGAPNALQPATGKPPGGSSSPKNRAIPDEASQPAALDQRTPPPIELANTQTSSNQRLFDARRFKRPFNANRRNWLIRNAAPADLPLIPAMRTIIAARDKSEIQPAGTREGASLGIVNRLQQTSVAQEDNGNLHT